MNRTHRRPLRNLLAVFFRCYYFEFYFVFFLLAKILILDFQNWNLQMLVDDEIGTYFRNWMVLQVPQKMSQVQILGHLVAPILGEGFVSVMIILSSDFLLLILEFYLCSTFLEQIYY